MTAKRRIEVFSADCPACDDTVALVRSIACTSCEIEVLDMRNKAVAERAKQYGIRRVPAIVIDGKLSDCCTSGGPDSDILKAAGVGSPLA